ncbi:autotransporter outer membrane beta-barrel domain-containing protein [Spiribacter onubensis]|uniref:Autotransporter outer membrane beta-barrel domain-containing protein n=1 Tax=Spiribacter onubensis TaxID=3122420 RepID=A0ABV3SA14_9GAMM
MICLACVLAVAPQVAAEQYRVIQNRADFGWLNQYSLDDAAHDFVGAEACVPTSSTNAMTFFQNAYEFYFADRLTGRSYADWIETDTLLITEPYMDTQPGEGTGAQDALRGLEKYILADNGFDLVSIEGMIPAEVFDPIQPDYPGRDRIIDAIPTWEFIESSLAAGNATLINFFYPDMEGGHSILVTGFDWVDANGDGVIQESEGAKLYAVDPLDPSQTYPDGQPGGGAKFTEIDVWNDPEDGVLLLSYSQYSGSLPYDPEAYFTTEGDGLLLALSINTQRVQDFIASVESAGFFFSDFPESTVRDQAVYQTRLQRRAGINLRHARVGETDFWGSAEGGDAEMTYGDRRPRAAMVGVERRFSETAMVGAALRVDDSRSDWNDAGDLKRRDYKASLYGGYLQGALSLTGALTVGRQDYDSIRRFSIGDETRQHAGDTRGDILAGGVELDYTMEAGALMHGPFARLLAQHVRVNGYTEDAQDGEQSTRLTVGSQRYGSLAGALGWQFARTAGSWTPYGSVALNHEFDGDAEELALTSWAGSEMTLPLDSSRKAYRTLNLGVVKTLASGVRLAVDLDLRNDSERGTDRWVSASVTVPL